MQEGKEPPNASSIQLELYSNTIKNASVLLKFLYIFLPKYRSRFLFTLTNCLCCIFFCTNYDILQQFTAFFYHLLRIIIVP